MGPPLVFQEVPCRLCGSERRTIIVETEPHKVLPGTRFTEVRCQDCDLIYLSPALDGPSLSRAYGSLGPPGAAGEQSSSIWRRLNERDLVARKVEMGPVLDVGCGSGDQMLAVAARGFKVEGFDQDEAAIAYAKERGLNAHVGRIESFIPGKQYGAILLSHVLEHVSDPVAVLSRLGTYLKPGGSLIIAVPDVRSPVRYLFGAEWHGWDPPFHLQHFDRSSMRRTIQLAGLEPVHIWSHGSVEDVTRSLDLRSGSPSRRLFIRLALLPIAWLGTGIGRGSYLLATGRRPGPDGGMGRHNVRPRSQLGVAIPSRRTLFGRTLRLPLDLLPHVPLWILSGPMRGKRWIANSSTHGYLVGTHEREKQDLFAASIKSGSLVFDLGAHVGFFSLLACSRGAQVVAVEPISTNANYARRHLAMNGCDAEVIEAAVARTDGSASFAPGPNLSTGRLGQEGSTVQTLALDTISERFGYPDVIKIDIEGAETDALLGGERTLERVRILFVASHYGQRDRCVELLRDKGFEVTSPWNDVDELVAVRRTLDAGD